MPRRLVRPLASLPLLALAACSADQGASPSLAVAQGGQCPLSAGQQHRAAADFGQMMQAFAHPRCANCHGGLDVFAPSAEKLHGGGQIPMKMVVDTASLQAGLGDGEPEPAPDYGACNDCHEPPNWQPPADTFSFAGRTPLQICRQLKSNNSPDVLKQHVIGDPLVLAGFAGRRGQHDLSPLPPPISHAAFEKAALDWVDVHDDGAHWKGGHDSDCGCIAEGKRLRITDHTRETSDRYGVEEDLTYTADVVMKDDGSNDFEGTGTYAGSTLTYKLNCLNGAPDDIQTHTLQGSFQASGSVSPFGDQRLVNYHFETNDWPLDLVSPLLLGQSPTPDDIAAAHKAGSIIGLMKRLDGPKTVIHTHTVDDGHADHMPSCVKWVSHDEDVTIEQFTE